MRTFIAAICFCFFSGFVFSQANTQTFNFPRAAVTSPSFPKPDYAAKLFCTEKPVPVGVQKTKNIYQKKGIQNAPERAAAPPLPPMVRGKHFLGNAFGNSTPNDNDLAISNAGKIVSVINTNLFFYDAIADSVLGTQSYDAFTDALGIYEDVFDPKVIYDPNEDKFITVILNGFTDTNTSIIIGFSQSNDPMGLWNLYSLPGNPLNNGTFSDYPMISLTEKELFLTINLVIPDSTWQTGFDETLVWQIKKEQGFLGGNISTVMHNGITFNGKPLRNLCPVRGGSQLYGPDMYFLSNRNFETQGDTIFLVHTTDTIGSPNFNIEVKQMNADADYFLAGDARMAGVHLFATNDSRILGAFYENNQIQFVQNSMDTNTTFCGVYHGIVSNLQATTPTVNAKIIGDTICDFGYPNIAYAGNGSSNNNAVIGFNHTAPSVRPGCSAIKSDGNFNYTPVLKITDGASSYVNVLSSLQERWGDYSGIQTKYNQPGEIWMSGYYAYASGFNRLHRAYIGQVLADSIDNSAGLQITQQNEMQGTIFPNPSADFFSIEFTIEKAHYLSFDLYDINGKLVITLMRDWAKPGKNLFSFRTADLKVGAYLLQVNHQGRPLFSGKVLKK
jgi:hypothetical protein